MLSALAAAVVISAVFADGFAPDEGDEAVQIWNVGARGVDLTGYRLADASGDAVFPAGTHLPAGDRWWLARDASEFARTFGEAPDWAWTSSPPGAWPVGRSRVAGVVGQMVVRTAPPRLANVGDTIRLVAPLGGYADVVRYALATETDSAGSAVSAGWRGPAVVPYRLTGVGAGAQVLYRKLDPLLGLPVTDTDGAADWASDPDDEALGGRVRLPGWDLEDRVVPVRVPVRAVRVDEDGGTLADGAVELAVAPDALLPFLRRHLAAARSSIDVAAYTFDNADLADVVAGQAERGVRVRVMVDGSPVGGHAPEQRWCLARIAAAGGDVRFMDQGGDVRPRYRSFHAKVIVIDGRVVLIGTENPGLGAAPVPGRPGRRGAYLAAALPDVAAWGNDLIARDVDPSHHADVRPFQPADPVRGAPAVDYVPPRADDVPGSYAPIAPDPVLLTDLTGLSLLTAPENILHPTAGLLALVDRAGPGDGVRVAQLREPWSWGTAASTLTTAGDDSPDGRPTNPRVAAYLGAARRGARVRVLLDGRFDDAASPDGNWATAARLNAVARAEHLDLEARLADPAGGGLHAKIVLVGLAAGRDVGALRAAHWVHLGSWNGTEVSAKANREAAVQFESAGGHAFLARVFDADWAGAAGMRVWVPWVGVGR